MAQNFTLSVPGYSPLRPLSLASKVYLCREDASDRMIVIKSKSTDKMNLLKKEIHALRDLQAFPYAPRLLFAHLVKQNEEQSELVLGMEYFLGDPLHLMNEKLNADQKRGLKLAMENAIHLLHNGFFRTHGDLSPKNILVKQGAENQVQICLVDWEFSENLNEENTSHHMNFRGTLGYSDPGSKSSLKEKDLESLSKNIHFLNLEPVKTKKGFLQGFLQW